MSCRSRKKNEVKAYYYLIFNYYNNDNVISAYTWDRYND